MMGGPKKAGAAISGPVWANISSQVGRLGEAEPGGREAMGRGVADWGGAWVSGGALLFMPRGSSRAGALASGQMPRRVPSRRLVAQSTRRGAAGKLNVDRWREAFTSWRWPVGQRLVH